MNFTIINEQVRQNCIQEVRNAPLGQLVSISKPKRSSPQNRYWHSLIGIIAKHMGEDADEIKLRIKYAVLPLKEVHVKGAVHMYPVSSAGLSKEDFTRLIEATLMMGAQLNISLPTPEYLGIAA